MKSGSGAVTLGHVLFPGQQLTSWEITRSFGTDSLIKTWAHMPVHIIHVAPARTPGKFAAFLGERQIVAASRTPFCDGARALLAEGTAAPGDLLVMRHAGGEHDALKAAVGVAAKLTVSEETNTGRPRFVSWTPHPKAPPMLSGDAPMRETGVQALIYRSA